MFGMGGSKMDLSMGAGPGMGSSYLGGSGDIGGMKMSGGGMDVMGTLDLNNNRMNDMWKNPLATSYGGD